MATKKQLEAQRLRGEGLSYAEIGRRLGISGHAVRLRLYGKHGRSPSTEIGYVNRNRQEVIEQTNERGPNLQYVYVLKCGDCGNEYGSYGGDNFEKKCPECQTTNKKGHPTPAAGPPISKVTPRPARRRARSISSN